MYAYDDVDFGKNNVATFFYYNFFEIRILTCDVRINFCCPRFEAIARKVCVFSPRCVVHGLDSARDFENRRVYGNAEAPRGGGNGVLNAWG